MLRKLFFRKKNDEPYIPHIVDIKFTNVETTLTLCLTKKDKTVRDLRRAIEGHSKCYPGSAVLIVDVNGKPLNPNMLLTNIKGPIYAKIRIVDVPELSKAIKAAKEFVKNTCSKPHSCFLESPIAGYKPNLVVLIKKSYELNEQGLYEPGSDDDVIEARKSLPLHYLGFPIRVLKFEYEEVIQL